MKKEKSELERIEELERILGLRERRKPKYKIILYKWEYKILDCTDKYVDSLLKDWSTGEEYSFETLEDAEKCMDRIMFWEIVVIKEYY